jgi:hypothetical protein
MMQTTYLHLVSMLRMHGAVPSSSPMCLRGLLLRQEQGHLCTIYNHRFQVIEFGKRASECESLGFPSGRVEVSALLGLSA